MSETRNLLIELGTEELPPKALKRLSTAFGEGVKTGLDKAGLHYGETKLYATPRRLAVQIRDLDVQQKDKQVERRGPALTAAFDGDGNPTKAATGFAGSCGVDVNELETMETDKGSWLVFRSTEKGQPTQALIPAIVTSALDGLPIPKRMRWGDLKAEFVRPVHWLVLLFGDEVIDAEILETRSGAETRGHRFHHPDTILIRDPLDYQSLLATEGKVLVDFEERRQAIHGQVLEVAAQTGGEAVIDDDLLDEVTALVEWPVAVVGNFDKQFLDVPPEALISTMKEHQKYFHLVDKEGKLLPHFITIANIESCNPDKVREGNERVVRPRLSDAEFFWTQDKKQALANKVENLKSILFQKKLGTLHDKMQRVQTLATAIAKLLDGDTEKAARAAELAKCDLMTEMVYEFPELQGIMGRYYALNDGEQNEVALALDEQYMPRFAGDQLPTTQTGQILAIADKLDTLVGIFAIGQPPSGTKDPFALRRATLGILRIITECRLDLDLAVLVDHAMSALTQQGVEAVEGVHGQILDFIFERLRYHYQEQGFAADTFEAVRARTPTNPLDLEQRLTAVDAFRRLPEAEALAAANKRIRNILNKTEETIPDTVDQQRFEHDEERALFEQLSSLREATAESFQQRRYEEGLKELAALRQPVDAFFDEVMVMAEDEALRQNRLALLHQLSELFLKVADLSHLQS